ncbi:hypothetical protein [Streptacidiphilus jiangxiensis]|uniref:Uncharacterized protein n=1 Tax=Streptacidiphilus jiangxiensis TaxID=235985 RepID=A0A1H7GBZ3_STRJI|nr:hypothetical protein [Streptacidiphilus jiangxiensis]SEK33345.1 hypothetical protein SAMN05414137_101547 [Streptacidiphilus jiangxiensis]
MTMYSHPGPPTRTTGVAQAAHGRVRVNAVVTLVLAALTVWTLTLPWASYSGESGDLHWSGFDVMNNNSGQLSDSSANSVDCLHALQWIGVALIVVSVLRLLAPAVRMAWLGAVLGLGLLVSAVAALAQFHQSLQNGGVFAPSMQAGPVVAAVAALLCLAAGVGGLVAERP